MSPEVRGRGLHAGMPMMQTQNILREAASWAEGDPRVSGVALVGSHARGEAGPDSDIDLIIVSIDPGSLVNDTAWVARFGAIESLKVEHYEFVTSVRVFYLDGPEVEFGVTGEEWAQLPLDPGTRQVICGGMRILYDESGLLREAQEAVSGTG
jgi:predicted nucleotidyltransferase